MYTLDVSLDEVRLTRERLRRVSQQLAEIAEPLASGPGQIGGSWQGRAAEQVTAEMTGLAGRVRRAADLMAESSRVVSDFEVAAQQALDDVAVLNRRVGSAQDEHAAQLVTVSRTQSFLSADGGGGPQAVARARAAAEGGRADADADLSRVLRYAQTEYEEILARFRTAAARMGTGLAEATIAPVPAAVAAGYHGGPVTSAELALLRESALAELRPELALTAARHQGGWDLFATREQAEAEASRLAGSVDRSLDAGQAPSTQDVAALARYGHNRWFASAFITGVGPAGLVRMGSRIESMVAAYPDTHPLATPQEVDQVRTGARALMGAVAATFTTAAGPAQDAGGASPPGGGLPDGYARDMAEAGTADAESGYSLSVLLHLSGKVDPAVALTLATGVYDAQRADPEARTWATLDDPVMLGSRPHDLFGHPEWADPMTGAAELLARDPATAQTFLLGPDAPHPADSSPADPALAVAAADPATSRLHHLTAVRDWSGSDGGTAYGHLLEAATTTLRDHDGTDSPGYRSAQIAATYLHYLPADLPEALKPATGHILAAYINDVQRSQASGDQSGDVWAADDPHLPGTQAYGVALDRSDTTHALKVVMGNGEAFKSIIAAQRALTQQELAHTAEALRQAASGTDRTHALAAWNGAIGGNAVLWGASMDAANLTHIAEGQASDARNQALLDLASVATISIPAGQPIEFAFSFAHDHVLTQAPLSHEHDERLMANNTHELTKNAIRDMVVTAALDHRLLEPGAPLCDYQPRDPSGSYTTFLRSDGTLIPRAQMTTDQEQWYLTWLEDQFSPERKDIADGFDEGMARY